MAFHCVDFWLITFVHNYYCLYHCYKDENKHTISASFLMPNLNDLGFQSNFSVEIWFSYAITCCLNRNRELYECRGLKYVTGYSFEAPSNKKSTHCFTLNYPEKVDGWNISHELSKEIEAKKVNFYNYHKHKGDLQASEENKLFPPRFTVLKFMHLEFICLLRFCQARHQRMPLLYPTIIVMITDLHLKNC